MNWNQFFSVVAAGAFGTGVRFTIAVWAPKIFGTGFPYATLIVNLAGCFLMGLVTELAMTTPLISPTLRLALTTGFLGGFTTYSAFNHETTYLLREHEWASGLVNLVITVGGCFAAGALGMLLAKRVVMAVGE